MILYVIKMTVFLSPSDGMNIFMNRKIRYILLSHCDKISLNEIIHSFITHFISYFEKAYTDYILIQLIK